MHRFCVWLVLLHDAIYWQALCNNCYSILRKKFKAWITGVCCFVWLTNGFVGMPHSYGRASLVSEQDEGDNGGECSAKGSAGWQRRGTKITVFKRRG